jgi:PD-(D/E)XK nuclease superfamily protein
VEPILTPIQRRTMDELIRVGESGQLSPDLEARLRARLEAASAQAGADGMAGAAALRLSKQRLNDGARCQGLFLSGLLGERPPFAFSARAARGTLLHKVIEAEVGSRVQLDSRSLAGEAARRLADHRGFGPFWSSLEPWDQDELLMDAARSLELFRASFPPMVALRRVLVPVSEVWLEAGLLGGKVILSGRVDLMLHRPDPVRSTRLLLDLKSGRAWPDHPEDMRLYALLYTLRYGVPPLRVATVFLESGQAQAEDVTEEVLDHAADRVAGSIRMAVELLRGRPAALTGGPYCRWCPRRATCPAADAALDPSPVG